MLLACHADDINIEYVEFVVSKANFTEASSRTSMLVDGWPCRNGLELLIHVIAHEMAHIIQFHMVDAFGYDVNDSAAVFTAYEKFAYPHGFHDGLFGSLVFNFFGHPMGVNKLALQSSTKKIRNKKDMAKLNHDTKCEYTAFYKRK